MEDSSNYRPRWTTRRTLLGGLATAGAGALAGCSTILGSGSTDTFRIGTGRPPVTLDPVTARSIGSEQVIDRIFEGLFAYGEGTDVVPAIASGEAEFADDRRKVVVDLDGGARFQNGRAVRAQDVVYSFEARSRRTRRRRGGSTRSSPSKRSTIGRSASRSTTRTRGSTTR